MNLWLSSLIGIRSLVLGLCWWLELKYSFQGLDFSMLLSGSSGSSSVDKSLSHGVFWPPALEQYIWLE